MPGKVTRPGDFALPRGAAFDTAFWVRLRGLLFDVPPDSDMTVTLRPLATRGTHRRLHRARS
jgi:hypothetical protein